ncbi:unnamed protein product, partial [marine sediment metagenome]
MNKTEVKELYKKISKKILNPEILDGISLEKEFVRKYIESPLFSNKLLSIVENKD